MMPTFHKIHKSLINLTLLVISSLNFIFSNVSHLPTQTPLSHYQVLWKDSALTRQPKAEASPTKSQLQEWLLGGVLDLGGDYMVTLKHKTKPESQRFNLYDFKKNSATGFELIKVQMNANNWKETKVAFKDNRGKINWISFDLSKNKKPTIQKVSEVKAIIKSSIEKNTKSNKINKNQKVNKETIFYNKSAKNTQSEASTSN